MKRILAFLIAAFTAVSVLNAVPVFAESAENEKVIYSTDFSESRRWFWQKERPNNDKNEFPTGFSKELGAYTHYPFSTTRLSLVRPDFKLETGVTYQIKYKVFSGQNQTNYLTFNFGNNSVYVRTRKSEDVKFGSSYPWWADDCYHPNIGGLWYNAAYRFTVDKIIGSNGAEIAATGIEYMEFVCAADSALRFKDLEISRIDGIKTEKTMVSENETPGNQKVLKLGFDGEADGALKFSGKGRHTYPVNLPMKKGASYRVSYYAKSNTADTEASLSLEGADVSVKIPFKYGGSGKWEHFCSFIDGENMTAESVSIDIKSESDISIDDFYVEEYINYVSVSVDAVKAAVSPTVITDVSQYSDAEFEIIPAEGSEIRAVNYGGVDYSYLIADLSKGGKIKLNTGKIGGVLDVSCGKPIFGSVLINGSNMVGKKLTADCGEADTSPLTESFSYNWEVLDDGEWKNFSDEKTVTADKTLEEKTVRCTVSWKRKNQDIEKTLVSELVKIYAERDIPQISVGNIVFENGEYRVEHKNGDIKFVWEYKNGDIWTEIPGENADTYAPTPNMIGKTLRAGGYTVFSDGLKGEKTYSLNEVTVSDGAAVFVSPEGDDNAAGSKSDPFRTIARAAEYVREFRLSNPDVSVTVMLRNGEYEPFTLTAKDSGTEENPIVYKAYNGESVTVSGGIKISSDRITAAPESIKNLVIDKTAAERLMQIDLSGITDIGVRADYVFDMNLKGTQYEVFKKYPKIFVNGAQLDDARYPNDPEGDLKITNGRNTDAVNEFSYEDKNSRTALWSEESIKNLRLRGHTCCWWTYSDYAVTSFNPSVKSGTTAGNTSYGFVKDHSFYFYNIPEEIDVPGEMYADPETDMVYFYPIGDGAQEVFVPISDKTLLTVNGAENITFENIDFKYTNGKAFSVTSAKNIAFYNCEFGYFYRMNDFDGTSLAMKNCYMHDAATGGVKLSGGNQKTLTKSGNIIENSVFRRCDNIMRNYAPAIFLSGVGNVIRNNDIGYAYHELIALEGQDHLIADNEIHHGVSWAGDMGAIYWGRSPKITGLEIAGNYFHNHASKIGNGWAQSVFWDDGAIGPYMHDNVFYKGTLSKSSGGNMMAVKTHGGQYSTIENNVFVDNPYALQFQTWAYNHKDLKEKRWWSYIYDKYSGGNKGWLGQFIEVDFSGDAWQNHYKDSHWSEYMKIWSMSFYNENLKDLDPKNAEDAAKIDALAEQYAPSKTNVFKNNVVIKPSDTETPLYPQYAGSGDAVNTYISASELTSSGKPIFKDYGKDFTITDDGLAEIKEYVPEFKAVDMSGVGAAWSKPSVSEVSLKNVDMRTLEAEYVLDNEGNSKYRWLVNGKTEGFGKTFYLEDKYIGKTVVCEVTPIDRNGLEGDAVVSADYTVPNYANAHLKDIKIDGTIIKGFSKNRFGYSAAVESVPTVTAEAETEGSTVSVSLPDSVPGNVVITVTAPNGINIVIYTIRLVKTEGKTEPDNPTPVTPGGAGGGAGGGGGTTRPSGNKGTNGFYSGETTNPSISNPFTDMVNHWAAADVLAMNKAGIVSGVSDTLFDPDRNITRAEFAAIIARALKLSDKKADYKDVNDEWFAPYVGACSEAGIISGYDGMFRPNDNITRQEMAVIIV
ncbi:MAG: S-layer homology domain-containing protein, partial [Clostridia bacterium]|nr:S-layer homology domain-containing protein [Clostridia bacterium]